MNLKKILVNSFVVCSVASALLATGTSAYANEIKTEFVASNFYEYTTSRNGSNSNISCEKTRTTLTGWTGYTGSYKWVRFSILGEANGSYYSINATENNGYTTSVSTNNLTVDSEVARKIYKAKLHGTSNPNSTIIDNYDIRVNKYNRPQN